MKLFHSIDLCVLMIYVIATHLLLSQRANSEYFEKTRLYPRGLKSVFDGIKATAVVLRGSKEIHSFTPNTRKFVKTGNYKTAVTDFFSVNPSNVRDYTRPGVNGKVGTIGDRMITVENRHGTSIGTLTIFKRKMRDGKDAKEIIYTDLPTYPLYNKMLQLDGEGISL